ncbi:hypothetical protein [Photobacterium phosphoreum]|uniref:hypothetical protein n=1 Tax=Photobacterium phosphoreum TaxID=659 RepID=UPI001E44F4C8|nr:hypothetical protein [Photobacterium phosphoreum]MCD9477149.1 hypothetical protein [Photobacterium phosphoreum]MCF2177974.1 hypothetical protein [Photobacterium phosphoreum]
MQLHQYYQQNRAQRIEPFLTFATQSMHYNIVLCYLMNPDDNDNNDTIFNTVAELLLSVACPEQWKEVPSSLRHQEIQQAAALSLSFRDDVKTLRTLLQYPKKES